MNHEQARELLHDYLDGTLGREQRRTLEAYLEENSELREELIQLHRLLDRVAALPEEVAPARDLWPGIAAAIVEGGTAVEPGLWGHLAAWRPTFRERPILALRPALAVAAVLALVLLAALFQRDGDGGSELAVTPDATDEQWTEQGPGPGSGQGSGTWQAGESYAVLVALELECMPVTSLAISHLGPAEDNQTVQSLGLIAHQQRIVDLAIADLRVAWAMYPESPYLTRLLKNAYRTKADLQRRATELAVHI